MSTTPRTVLDGKTFGIGVLTVTACVLFVGLILVSQQTPAYGIGLNDRGGDYIVVTQQISNTSEGIVVIDAAAKQLLIYRFDYNNKSLEILSRVALQNLPVPRARDMDAQPRRRR